MEEHPERLPARQSDLPPGRQPARRPPVPPAPVRRTVPNNAPDNAPNSAPNRAPGNTPGNTPPRNAPNGPGSDLARTVESRRRLDARSEEPGGPGGSGGRGDNLPVPFRSQQPASDSTTTMPIFIPPMDGGAGTLPPAPPGQPGHYHTDEEGARHRGGTKLGRGTAATISFVVAIGAGIALTSAFSGNSATPTSSGAGLQPPVLGAGTSSTSNGPGATPPAGPDPSAANPSASASAKGSRAASATASRTPQPSPTQPTTAASPTGTGAAEINIPGGVRPPVTTPVGRTPGVTGTTGPTPTAGPPTTSAFTTLQYGSTGPAVAAMQQLLVDAKYLSPGNYQQGIFGNSTKNTVKWFQGNHPATRSDPSGVYGAATAAALQACLPNSC